MLSKLYLQCSPLSVGPYGGFNSWTEWSSLGFIFLGEFRYAQLVRCSKPCKYYGNIKGIKLKIKKRKKFNKYFATCVLCRWITMIQGFFHIQFEYLNNQFFFPLFLSNVFVLSFYNDLVINITGTFSNFLFTGNLIGVVFNETIKPFLLWHYRFSMVSNSLGVLSQLSRSGD